MARKGMIGGLVMVIGAILLVVSLLVGWYAVTGSIGSGAFSGTLTLTLKPGSQYTYSASAAGLSISNTCSYSGSNGTTGCVGNLAKTGQLYSIVEYLLIVGIIVGFLGAILAMMSGGRRKGAVMGLAVIALLVAIVAPMVLLAAQPGAIKSDLGSSSGGFGSNNTGPQSSFFGSSNGFTWGPSTGWYLSIGAFVLFLIGMLLSGRGTEAAAPAPMSPAPMDQQGAGTSTMGSPPMGPS